MLLLSLLFKRFLKLGATAYGGPAIAQQMKKTVVKEWGWLKEPEFMQGLAFCQMLPGPTFVMLSTYIGYRLRGIWGAFLSAIAFVLPSFVLILILSVLYFRFGDLWYIQSLFKGLGAVVVAIVLNAFINFGKSILQGWKMILISSLSFFGFVLRWNILLVFILAAMAALVLRPAAAKTAPAQSGSPVESKRGDYLFLGTLAVFFIGIFALCYGLDTELFSLSLTMSKIGALAFGGGFTAIPLIQYEVVDRFRWVNTKEFLDGIAMGQITPGPITITATFLGYKLGGLWGGLMATIGMYSPSFFIITLLLPYYDRLKGSETVRKIEQGILGSFIGMLALVLYNFGRTTFVDIPSVLFTAGAFIALLKRVDLAYILAAGAALSILIFGYLT